MNPKRKPKPPPPEQEQITLPSWFSGYQKSQAPEMRAITPDGRVIENLNCIHGKPDWVTCGSCAVEVRKALTA